MKRLLIIDSYTIDWLDRASKVAQQGDEWHLIILGVSDTWFKRKFAGQLSRLGLWQVINLSSFVGDATDKVKSFVVPLIAHLPEMQVGGITLARLLDSLRGTRWWFTEICEKSGWRTPFINRLYQLALIRAVASQENYDEAWLHSTTPYITSIFQRAPAFPKIIPLTQCSVSPFNVAWRYLCNAILIVAAMTVVRLVLFTTGWQAQYDDVKLFFFSIYPYWWTQAMERDATDRFFATMPEGISARFLVWLSHPREIWARRHGMIKVMHDKKMIPLQIFVRWHDVFRLFNPVYALKLWRVVSVIRQQKKFEFVGLDVSSLVCDELINSIVSRE